MASFKPYAFNLVPLWRSSWQLQTGSLSQGAFKDTHTHRDKDSVIEDKQRGRVAGRLEIWMFGICDDEMAIHASRCLPALPQLGEVTLEHSHSAGCWWESQICQCSCQLYPDFQLYWGLSATSILQRYPFIYLCLAASVPSLLPSFHTGTIARTMPGCHHIKRQRSEREGGRSRGTGREKERDRWGTRQRITVRLEIWLCIKAKLRETNFLLNWLYVHEKQKTTTSLSRRVALRVCPVVPAVYTLPLPTFTRRYLMQLSHGRLSRCVYSAHRVLTQHPVPSQLSDREF